MSFTESFQAMLEAKIGDIKAKADKEIVRVQYTLAVLDQFPDFPVELIDTEKDTISIDPFCYLSFEIYIPRNLPRFNAIVAMLKEKGWVQNWLTDDTKTGMLSVQFTAPFKTMVQGNLQQVHLNVRANPNTEGSTCVRVQIGTHHVEAHDDPVYEWTCPDGANEMKAIQEANHENG